MRFFLCLFITLGLLLSSGHEALAQRNSDVPLVKINFERDRKACEELKASPDKPGMKDDFFSSGGAICPCASGVWIERIIGCFTSETYGVIPEVMKAVMSGTSNNPNAPSYKKFSDAIVYGSILLAVILYGLNLMMGTIRSLPKDTFMLILKIGGVLLFFSQFQEIYINLLRMLAQGVNIVGAAAGDIGDICDVDVNGRASSIWARWDCLFVKFTGLVGGYIGGGVIGFMTTWLFAGGAAAAAFVGVGYVIVTILLMGMRLVYTYIVAIIGLSFVYLLAPLFVPLIFFGQTYQKFTTWFKILLAYLLQPMLLVLFSVLVLTALEFAIFVGPTSLYGTITNKPDIAESVNFSEAFSGEENQAFSDPTNNWFSYVAHRPIFSYTQHTDPGVLTTNSSESDAVQQQTDDGGVITNRGDTLEDGSFKGGITSPQLDFEGVALALGVNDKIVTQLDANGNPELDADGNPITYTITRQDEWILAVITQVAATAILVFILYSLIVAAPQITHDLVAQNLKGFGGVAKARMVGEAEVRKSLEGTKEAMKRGKESGDHSDAVKSVMKEMLGR